MISCEKAAVICNKTQYNEASFMEKLKLRFHLFIMEKLKLRFHLFMCKNCSAFTKKNTKLTALCENAKLQSLSEQEKLRMKKKLQSKY